MSIIYILIPIAIVLVCIAIWVFFWAVKSNQFEDLERHGHSILFDDDLPSKSKLDKPPVQKKHSSDE
jgi:cbb3-type cytochrome oxidase maturation protein